MIEVPKSWVLRKVYVLHQSEVPQVQAALPDRYLHPDIFYLSHSISVRVSKNGLDREYGALTPVNTQKLRIWRLGHDCHQRRMDELRAEKEFVQRSPMRTLDLFAGVGAFSLGLKESGGFSITHAIEIGPSTAKTLKCCFPDRS
jgi:hypothetical protein